MRAFLPLNILAVGSVNDMNQTLKTKIILGVLAIDGKTGKRLWTQWAPHEVFAITCQGDLDKDGINDCVAGGRAGVSNIT